MASYLTPAQLRTAIAPHPEAVAGSAASLEDVELQIAIASAQAEVDARLSNRYKVPFDTPIPALVNTLVTGKAIYLATLQYRGSKDLAAYDPVVLRHAQVDALLKDVAAGRAGLLELDGTAPAEQSGGSGVGAAINPYEGEMFGPSAFGLVRGGMLRDGW